MRSPLQEKIQLNAVRTKKEKSEWVSFESARQSQANVPSFTGKTIESEDHLGKFNRMPPGMDIDNQNCVEINHMKTVMSGETDQSKDTNPDAFEYGFKVREMKGTDDQYTGEHVDLFYGTVYGDSDVPGFAERNNYLDRI